jgi:hypothetical protein
VTVTDATFAAQVERSPPPVVADRDGLLTLSFDTPLTLS